MILLCLLLVGFIKNKLKKNKELKLNKNEMEDFEDYKRYIVFNLYALCEALYYRYWKVFGFFIVSAFMTLIYIFLRS